MKVNRNKRNIWKIRIKSKNSSKKVIQNPQLTLKKFRVGPEPFVSVLPSVAVHSLSELL